MKHKVRNFQTNVIDERLGAGSYFKVLTAPGTATVSFKIGSTDSDAIILNENDSSDFEHQGNIYVTIEGLLQGEFVKVIFAEGEFSINNESSNTNIGSYNAAALYQLDKMLNRYDIPDYSGVGSTSTVLVTLLNKVLTCDKISLFINANRCETGGAASIDATLDGVLISQATMAFLTPNINAEITLEGVKGKTLVIKGYHTSGFGVFYALQEFNLKA
jgi:hypothetical protein